MKKKLFLKSDEVKFLACPMYEGLSIQDILEKVGNSQAVVKHLPDERDIHKVPRQWIINVSYALLGPEFSNWVDLAIANRNMEVAKKQDLVLNLDSEILKAFHSSKNISTVSISAPLMQNLWLC